MERIRPVCSVISHDLNNIIGILQGYIELLRPEVSSEDGRSFLGQIAEAAERLQERSQDLQDFYVGRRGVSIPFPVLSLIRPLLDSYSPIDFECSVPEEVTVQIDPTTFPLALEEILKNAREASPQQALQLSLTAAANGLSLRLQNQALLAEADLRRAFDPWFSTRSRHRGLGLARVFGHLSRQGLAFRLASDENSTVVFEIDLVLAGPG
jgi:signal transduction histidine kinase